VRPEPLDRVSLVVLAIVQEQDAGGLIDELVARGLQATRIDSKGGFLIERNAVVMVGTDEQHLQAILDAIAKTCESRIAWAPVMPVGDPLSGIGMPIQVEVGGAVVFVLEVERCVRLVGTARREPVGSVSGRG
jgi:uncharacterized protein YaaQ